jgi:hypothetical protein
MASASPARFILASILASALILVLTGYGAVFPGSVASLFVLVVSLWYAIFHRNFSDFTISDYEYMGLPQVALNALLTFAGPRIDGVTASAAVSATGLYFLFDYHLRRVNEAVEPL